MPLPSDSNGVYSLPAGYLATTGDTIQASQHNPPLEDLASSMSARLMRSGAAPMTGPLKATDGSVGSPAVQFANASSTGIYKTTSGIGVSVGGTKVAEFGAGGIVSGARYVGEIIPYSASRIPPLTVQLYGQTLSRTAYPDLWELAQFEIAAGDTFYNNGNGTTTFGVADLRCRVLAGWDFMGGAASGRLGAVAGFNANATIIGATGGAETHALTASENGVHSHPNTLSDPGHDHPYNRPASFGASGGGTGITGTFTPGTTGSSTTGITINNASSGSGDAHNNVQPTIIVSFLLFAGA